MMTIKQIMQYELLGTVEEDSLPSLDLHSGGNDFDSSQCFMCPERSKPAISPRSETCMSNWLEVFQSSGAVPSVSWTRI